jgi:hypothetical protein
VAVTELEKERLYIADYLARAIEIETVSRGYEETVKVSRDGLRYRAYEWDGTVTVRLKVDRAKWTQEYEKGQLGYQKARQNEQVSEG